jgi:pimeloyl-ACP methyl ester carboxylesterase
MDLETEITGYLTRPDGIRLAYCATEPARADDPQPLGWLWCGGFRSSMTGGKATALHVAAIEDGRGFVRFDYRGHGGSDGDFDGLVLSDWIEDATLVFDTLTTGPQIVFGSSMGGWVALHLALLRPERVAGLVLIAPAPDFTESLMWRSFSPDVRRTIETEGLWMRPSPYGDGDYPITRALIEDGRRRLLLETPDGAPKRVPLTLPIRILHGMADADVPWGIGRAVLEAVDSADVSLTLVKDGDHRLSEPANLTRLVETARSLSRALETKAPLSLAGTIA